MESREKRKEEREAKKERKSSFFPFLSSFLFSLSSFLALLSLPACGFHPVYGTMDSDGSSHVANLLNDVAIDSIPDRNGQILRNNLIDRMYGDGRPASPRYHLSVSITRSEADTGILTDATSTRAVVTIAAKYTLTDDKKAVLFSGTANSVASFTKLVQQYGTEAAREDADQRALHEISEQLVTRLSMYFSAHGN